MVGAVAWHLRVGRPWRAPPRGWPHWRKAYGWFRRWQELGLSDALLRHVALLRHGALLGGAVVPASVQDCDCMQAPSASKQVWPNLREAVLDEAFAAERCREWSNLHGMRHRVVERALHQKGLVVLERRWVVERSFGWLTRWGGLLCDRSGWMCPQPVLHALSCSAGLKH